MTTSKRKAVPKPTRTTVDHNGSQTVEYAALNSVELTNTVRDGWSVAGVKIYDNDPFHAVDVAMETAAYAQQLVDAWRLKAMEQKEEKDV